MAQGQAGHPLSAIIFAIARESRSEFFRQPCPGPLKAARCEERMAVFQRILEIGSNGHLCAVWLLISYNQAMLNAFLIVIALMAFGVVHSLLASHEAKQIAQRLIGTNVATATYRLVYNVLAFATILPALYLVFRLPNQELYRFPAPWDSIVLGLQVLAAVGLVYSVYQMDVWFFLGVRQLGEPPQLGVRYSIDSTSTPQLVTNGLYRFVRHPLYTTSLIVLYLASPMSLNWLAFAIGCNVYFLAGSIFEERKLVREFGSAYRVYQQRVPRLLPRPWRWLR